MSIKKITILFTISLLMQSFASCNKESDELAELNFPTEIQVTEGTNVLTEAVVTVTLSTKSNKDVTLRWSTQEGTAIAGQDFVPQLDQELVLKAGQTTAEIKIQIISDTIYEASEYLFVVANRVQNARLGNAQCKITILNDDEFIPTLQLPERMFFPEGTATPLQASIPLRLSGPATQAITLKYSTIQGTAKAQEDYIPVLNQLVVFNPGETEKFAVVQLVNDNIFEMDDQFVVRFTEITNAVASNTETKVVILNDDFYTPEMTAEGAITPASYPLMQLSWSDEFDGPSINTNNWGYNTGAGGWGNNEWQTYTTSSENSFIEDGKLNIVATKLYTAYFSARMLTQGKKEFKYGRIDIRAKMPYGQGIWPALWMLGANFGQVGWPRCGEIDIMEYLGHEQSKVHGTVHYWDNAHRYRGGSYTLPNNQSFHDKFHVFSIVWQENAIRWYVNYQQYYEIKDTDVRYDAFRLPHFFIFNVAVGGNWPGYPNASTVFPQRMIVDYIRVFQVEE